MPLSDLKEKLQKDNRIMDSIVSFAAPIRSTPGFWKQRSAELKCMTEQLGPPSIFFTLSAADYHWKGLFKVLASQTEYSQLTNYQKKNTYA